jgi:hypothetical protein
MKRIIVTLLVLAVGIVIGKVWLQVAKTEAATKTQYQFMITDLNTYTSSFLSSPTGLKHATNVERQLNDVAMQGWEVVGFSGKIIILKK